MSAEDLDVTKDLVFDKPYEMKPAPTYSEDKSPRREYRDFTVAELEEVLWRIRAAGGTDSTPVKIGHQNEGALRAMHVEAFPVEIPRRIREPEPEPEPAQPTRSRLRDPRLIIAAAVVAVLLLGPAVLRLLIGMWGWAL